MHKLYITSLASQALNPTDVLMQLLCKQKLLYRIAGACNKMIKINYLPFFFLYRTRHRGGLKNFHGKEQISDILFFDGKISRLRNRHLVLRSLGTLTRQQRFYGTGLVVAKEGISTPSTPYLR